MSHSFVNQIIHVMWSTHNQQWSLPQSTKDELLAYLSSIVKSKNGMVFSAGGSSDHIHLLLLLPPELSLSTLLMHMKSYSSKWLKSNHSIDPKFAWQSGYLAFSVQRDRLDNVCNYIRSDKARHQSQALSYKDELIAVLNQQGIEYNPQYFLENSFSKIYIHTIWSTHNRIPYLEKHIRSHLYAQMKDVVTNFKGKIHEIGGIEDHVHVLMEVPKDKALSNLVREMKTCATHWLKRMDGTKFRDFEWQNGFGAFSISLSSIEAVKHYIQDQEEHHSKHSFKDEWNEFLQKYGFLKSASASVSVVL